MSGTCSLRPHTTTNAHHFSRKHAIARAVYRRMMLQSRMLIAQRGDRCRGGSRQVLVAMRARHGQRDPLLTRTPTLRVLVEEFEQIPPVVRSAIVAHLLPFGQGLGDSNVVQLILQKSQQRAFARSDVALKRDAQVSCSPTSLFAWRAPQINGRNPTGSRKRRLRSARRRTNQPNIPATAPAPWPSSSAPPRNLSAAMPGACSRASAAGRRPKGRCKGSERPALVIRCTQARVTRARAAPRNPIAINPRARCVSAARGST